LNNPLGDVLADDVAAPFLSQVASWWWVELILGIAWVVISIVVLKFNNASVVTVGVLAGIAFLLFAAEEFVIAAIDRHWWPVWAFFGVLLTAAGIVCLIHPRSTFLGFADILGFIFLMIGVLWMIQAFAEQPVNPVWWLGLISGVLMLVVAFWVSGEFLVDRAYTLLIFTGVWAMIKGITDIIRAFQIRSLA